eukprot:120803-Pyramimonas_sp.AAC.1
MNKGAAGGITEIPPGNREQGSLIEGYCHDIRRRLSELVRAERRGEGPPNAGNQGEQAGTGADAADNIPHHHRPRDHTGGDKRANPGKPRLITEWAQRVERAGKGEGTVPAGVGRGEQAVAKRRSERDIPQRWRDGPTTRDGTKEPLTILTWNAQGLRRKLVEVGDVAQFDEVIGGTNPDVAMIQETYVRVGREPRRGMEGYTRYFSSLPRARTRSKKQVVLQSQHQQTRAGVLTLVSNKLKPKHTVSRLQEPDHLQGYALALKVLTECGHMLLLNVYLPPGDDCRQVIMSGTTEWIRDVWPNGVAPVLIGGDFNGGWFCADRPSGGLTARDAHYRRWAGELGVGPTDLWTPNRERGLSFNPQAVSGNRASGDNGRSRVDDILLSRGGVGLAGSTVLNASRVAQGLAHTSDHDPILVQLNPDQIPWPRGESMNTGTQVVRRIRTGVTREEMENLKDLLEDELEEPVEELSRSLRDMGGRATGRLTREYIEHLATQVDGILARAWAVTLDQVGEEVT